MIGASVVFAAERPAVYAEPVVALDRAVRKSAPVACFGGSSNAASAQRSLVQRGSK
jgi:hypothetical protein